MVICQEYKENVQFYFRILFFFNLVEWVDLQVNVNSDVGLSGISNEFDGWFNVFIDLYIVLIIDYCLLCFLFFFEYLVEVIEVENNNNDDDEIEEVGRNLILYE